jgi:hypothetical protein
MSRQDILATSRPRFAQCWKFSGLAVLAPGFTGLFAIISEVARIVRRASALLTRLFSALPVLSRLTVAMLATFLARFRCALRIVREISGATALFVCHRFLPFLPGP